MDIKQAYKFAEQYGLSPRAFNSSDSFIAAVEQCIDKDMQTVVAKQAEEASRKRKHLRQTKHGHTFDPATFRCHDCGMSVREYLFSLAPDRFPMEETCIEKNKKDDEKNNKDHEAR